MKRYKVAIVGGGIVGAAIAYFLAPLNPKGSVALIEQEREAARHTSSRNTGKVHAPYLYDPDKKGLFARTAFVGYSMWKKYAQINGIPFRDDGVIEVALDAKQAATLERYHKWGIRNGLKEEDMTMLDGGDLLKAEPEVRCHTALVCNRDASVDYGMLTRQLVQDAVSHGVEFLSGHDATAMSAGDGHIRIMLNHIIPIEADFVVNAAGGRAIEIAHRLDVATQYSDVHFRGEYWQAPLAYHSLTSRSVYSVPSNPKYPFLDPHWIVRVDGTCEVGPNAVPVFGPYGYDMTSNARSILRKTLQMIGSGARRTAMDPQFQKMVFKEMRSSVSKHAMIGRVKRFMPRLDADRFMRRGVSGIRSLVVDTSGSFIPDVMIMQGPCSLHILNYNSPGATGALPFAAHVIRTAVDSGLHKNTTEDAACGPWRFGEVADATI